MLRNYRSLGSTRASYLSGLGSGKSQGDSVEAPVKDEIKLTFGLYLKLYDSIPLDVDDKEEVS